MIEVIDRRLEELNLPIDRSIDTPVYREAYIDLMKTSKQTRDSGLTYFGFLARMHKRNLARKASEYFKRIVVIDENREPNVYNALKTMIS